MSSWHLPIGIALVVTGLAMAAGAAGLLAMWAVQEWSQRTDSRRVSDYWPHQLADGGPLDRQQREDLLAGESVPEDPAVVRSVRRYLRKRGAR